MTINEAVSLLKNRGLIIKPTKGFEYKNIFVFHFGSDDALDSMFSVNKLTKQVSPFMPNMLSPEEYFKPIKIYTLKEGKTKNVDV